MCALCAALQSEHWAEDGGRRQRILRAALLDLVLGHFGLELREWGGRAYVLGDRKGRAEVVDDLGGVWAAAERLLGRRPDPLDPALLGAL